MTARRRPGRPSLKLGEASTGVNVRMPVSTFDKACALASRKRMNVPELLRRAFAQYARADRDEDDEDEDE